MTQLTAYLKDEESELDWMARIHKAIDFGAEELQQFQIIQHFLNSLKANLAKVNSFKDLETWVINYDKEWASVSDNWTETLKGVLDNTSVTISTHSQSESLKKAFHKLAQSGYELKILQTQSSPVNEGELQANWLVNKGIEVLLTTDAQGPAFVSNADLVVLGCDGIYSDGFVNKAGSLALCLAAAEFKKPVYVFADTRKISHNPAPEENPKPSTEVSSRSHPNLEVLNLYFERVPHYLVTGYVTEKGILEENI